MQKNDKTPASDNAGANALVRSCAWEGAKILARGPLVELLSPELVGNFEFEQAPTPAGPAAGQFPVGTAAAAYAYDEASAGFVEVSVKAQSMAAVALGSGAAR